jgi:protein O-mannosyl-transferase
MKSKIQETPITPNRPNGWLWAIMGVTFLLYLPALQNHFTNWDDPVYITVASGTLKDVFTKNVLGNYHPLTMLTLWFNFQLSGIKPMSYHLFNLALHLANVYLVFQLIWKLSTQKQWTTILVALFFAIHPLHVESVAWVTERKDVLYTFFFLLACLQYIEYLQRENQRNLAYTLLFFILSLLSKPAAVVLPLVLLLLDYYYNVRGISNKRLVTYSIFFAISIFFGILTYKIQTIEAVRTLQEHSIVSRFWFANYNLMMYAVKGIFPFGMSAVHPFPKQPFPLAYWISPLFTLCFIAILFFYRSQRQVVFGLLFFLVNLILVLQIITIGQTVMADRYTYVPHIGLFFALAFFFETQMNNSKMINLLRGMLGFGGLYCLFLTYDYLKTWKDGYTLWTNVIHYYPTHEVGYYNRAKFLEETQQINDAMKDYVKVLAINPNNIEAITNRGRILMIQGKFKEAHADFDLAQSQTNDLEKLKVIVLNKSYAFFYEGNRQKALEIAKEAKDKYNAPIDAKYWAELNK